MKILLLNQVFYPDVMATAQYLTELAAALAERGHEVTVVSSRRAYEHPDTLFPARETWRGVKIIRVFSTRFGKGAKWRRAADFASFLFFCGARLLVLPRHNVVMALTTPPLISFFGAWRAKLWRAKFCYWVMDFNPDEAIAAGWLQADSLAAKFLERLSRFSLQRANRIVALDRFMRDRIVAKGIASEKIAVIPPWSQDRDVRFDDAGREKFRTAHGWQNKFVVMYSGNHSPVHPLDTLMLAADQLRGETDLVFAFIGGGSEFPRIKKWAAAWDKAESGKRKAEIICLPYQPLEKLSASLSAADGHVVVMGNAMLGLVHPCKIYNIFAVGAPVVYIGPEPSHVTEAVAATAGTNANVNVRHGQAGRLAAEILRLKQNWPTAVARSAGAVEQFSAMRLLPQMVALLEVSQPAGSQGRGG